VRSVRLPYEGSVKPKFLVWLMFELAHLAQAGLRVNEDIDGHH